MPPRVVFLPGASGAAEFWAPVADRMPEGWQTRLLSFPGAGVEPHDPMINGYSDLMGWTATVVTDGSDVVAQSMGGAVAMGVALAYPRKIRRLVLVATSGGVDIARLGGEDWRAEYAAEFADAAPWVTSHHVDHSPDLRRVKTPTCLIWGDDDPISPLAVGRALDRALPCSGLHVVRGGTHMLARERPGEVAKLIVEHLS
ncbi:MAG: alpha/beta hydrolase [Solirubrobacteraceae bacterium]